MLTQKYYSADGLYSLEYPRVWDTEEYEHIPAFFDPLSGHGALQVFAADLSEIKNNEPVKKDLLIENYPYLAGDKLIDKMRIFLHMQDTGIDVSNLKMYTDNGINFIPFEYEIQGRFYMSVMMEKNNIVLLAMYNSTSYPEKKDAEIISNIIKSIKIKGQVI